MTRMQSKILNRAAAWAALAVLLGLATVAFSKDKTAGLSAEQRQKNLESFEMVWQTVRDKHWDPKLHGLDWQAIHDELKPLVEKAMTTDEARAVMQKMLGKLGQSHFAIIPSDLTGSGDKNDSQPPSGSGRTGMEVRIAGEQALVVQVLDDSPAAKVGVKLGWQLLKIGDREIAPILAKVREAYKGSTLLELRLARAVEEWLHGSVGSEVSIVFRDGDNQETTKKLKLSRPKGTIAAFGHISGVLVRFDARKLDGNIGYMGLSAFFDPVTVMKGVEQAIKDYQSTDGIILDLRGNTGGIGAMAIGIGNRFIKTADVKLRTMIMRDTTMYFTLFPQPDTYSGLLAVLVDGCSASTSEILAGGLQDLKRAKVFGTRTAGAALPSEIVLLPNGDGFQYAVANYISASGEVLEGRGVKPDVEIQPSRELLLKGQDPVIAAAVAWIKAAKKP